MGYIIEVQKLRFNIILSYFNHIKKPNLWKEDEQNRTDWCRGNWDESGIWQCHK